MTGGGAPAEIWRAFMAAALPRLAAKPIPGGPVVAQSTPDSIGDLLSDAASKKEPDILTPRPPSGRNPISAVPF